MTIAACPQAPTACRLNDAGRRSFTPAGLLLGLGLASPLVWDLGFLTLGAALVIGGLALRRSDPAQGQR